MVKQSYGVPSMRGPSILKILKKLIPLYFYIFLFIYFFFHRSNNDIKILYHTLLYVNSTVSLNAMYNPFESLKSFSKFASKFHIEKSVLPHNSKAKN